MRKSIMSALLLIVLAGNLQAMHLNRSGMGEVLIAPYYTVNGGNQTQISIANRSDQGKAVKVRFLEGMNGREVFGFNLYLAPHDLWTGAVFSQADDGAATLITRDDSCTVPALKNSTSLPQLPNGWRIAPFSNAQYSADRDDAGPNEVLRTREGYFEVIEMGEVINAAQRSLNDISPGFDGLPANCPRIESAWSPGGYWLQGAEIDLTAPGGGLTATVTLVDALDGTMYSYQAEAIDRFSSIVQHTAPGNALPNLATGVSNQSQGIVEAVVEVDGALITAQYPVARAIDAVSALLMAESIDNEFVTSASVGGASAWVVTLPTKKFYTDNAIVQSNAIAPFTKTFSQILVMPEPNPSLHARGEAADIDVKNREGGPEIIDCSIPPVPPSCIAIGVLPPPPLVLIPSIDWATNLFGFNARTQNQTDPLFGSRLSQLVAPADIGVSDGRMNLRLYDPQGVDSLPNHLLRADNTDHRFAGLPAIGFWAMSFTNGQLTPGVLSNYATLRRHSVTRRDASTAL